MSSNLKLSSQRQLSLYSFFNFYSLIIFGFTSSSYSSISTSTAILRYVLPIVKRVGEKIRSRHEISDKAISKLFLLCLLLRTKIISFLSLPSKLDSYLLNQQEISLCSFQSSVSLIKFQFQFFVFFLIKVLQTQLMSSTQVSPDKPSNSALSNPFFCSGHTSTIWDCQLFMKFENSKIGTHCAVCFFLEPRMNS